jgi:hypothetical protein
MVVILDGCVRVEQAENVHLVLFEFLCGHSVPQAFLYPDGALNFWWQSAFVLGPQL